MIKCPHCGANLSLEEERCPYCGQINEEARIHARQMKRFQSKFAATEQEVYHSVHGWRKVTARGIILGILVVLIIITSVLNARAYSLRRYWKERDAARNSTEYIAQIESLLEEQDYLTLAQFFEYRGIEPYYSKHYEPYGPIRSALRHFQSLYMDLAQAELPGRGGRSIYAVSNLSDDLDYFYRYTDEERITEDRSCDPEQTAAAFAGMREQMSGFLQAALKLGPEEAAELEKMSRSRRGLLLEEVFPSEEE